MVVKVLGGDVMNIVGVRSDGGEVVVRDLGAESVSDGALDLLSCSLFGHPPGMVGCLTPKALTAGGVEFRTEEWECSIKVRAQIW